MGKEIVKENIRVEVYAKSPGDFGFASMSGVFRTEDEELQMCEGIARDIRRHVDDLPSRGNSGVNVVYDTREYCEFCENTWEVDENGEPICCSRAANEFKETKKKESQ